MAVRLDLLEGSKLKAEDFAEHYSMVCDHLYFECLDDSGGSQGYAVAEITKKYKADGDGAFLLLKYIQVSDLYYEHWLRTTGGGNLFHHLCAHSWRGCRSKVGSDALVHVQKWVPIHRDLVKSVVKNWKTQPLDLGPPRPPKGISLVEEPVMTAPKAKPDRRDRGRRGERRDPGDGRGSRDRRGDDDSRMRSSEEDEDVGRSNARRSRKRRTSEHEDDSRERRGRPILARGTVGAVTRSKEAASYRHETPLDKMLEDEPGLSKTREEERFEELRKSLEERKKQNEVRGGASAVLARRVMEAPETNKKRKKESEKEKVQKALKILSGQKDKKASSTSDSLSEDDDEELIKGSRRDTDLAGKQRRLRKMAEAKPGCLLSRGYGLMHEQLGTLYGDKGVTSSADNLLQPAAVRYLLSSALPLMDLRKVGKEKLRELRTLSSALDLIVSGKIGLAGDYLMQRMKSILMGMRDGSTTASRYLELIPMEVYPTPSTMEEADYARSLAVQRAKSEQLLERAQARG